MTAPLPPHRHLSRQDLGNLAASLPLPQRLSLALAVQAEADATWLPRPGRLAAVLQHIPADIATLRALQHLVAPREEPRRLTAAAPTRHGPSEAVLGLAMAEAAARFAPQVLSPAERARALRGLSQRERALGLALFSADALDGAEAQLLAEASAALLPPGEPLSGGLLRHLATALARFDSGSALAAPLALQRRMGLLLARAVPDRRLGELDLAGVIAVQHLVAPSQLNTPPDADGLEQLNRLYTRAPGLPELDRFGEELAERVTARLLAATPEEIAPLAQAVHDWPNMTLQQRGIALFTLLALCAQAMDVPVPTLTAGDFTAAAGARWRGSVNGNGRDAFATVSLNTAPRHNALASFDLAVSVLLHEFTHCHQRLLEFAPSNTESATWPVDPDEPAPPVWPETPLNRSLATLFRSNIRHYISARDDRAAYRSQPVEREAFSAQATATPRVMQAISLLAWGKGPAYLLSAAVALMVGTPLPDPALLRRAARLMPELREARDLQDPALALRGAALLPQLRQARASGDEATQRAALRQLLPQAIAFARDAAPIQAALERYVHATVPGDGPAAFSRHRRDMERLCRLLEAEAAAAAAPAPRPAAPTRRMLPQPR